MWNPRVAKYFLCVSHNAPGAADSSAGAGDSAVRQASLLPSLWTDAGVSSLSLPLSLFSPPCHPSCPVTPDCFAPALQELGCCPDRYEPELSACVRPASVAASPINTI